LCQFAYGPTLAVGWGLGPGDFNHDSRPDYSLFDLNASDRDLVFVGPSFIGRMADPSQWMEWWLTILTATDRITLYNSGANQTAI
jgi:hypothetical protein